MGNVAHDPSCPGCKNRDGDKKCTRCSMREDEKENEEFYRALGNL